MSLATEQLVLTFLEDNSRGVGQAFFAAEVADKLKLPKSDVEKILESWCNNLWLTKERYYYDGADDIVFVNDGDLFSS